MKKLNFIENRITDDHVNHFKKNGWVNIDLGLDPIFIDKTLDETVGKNDEYIFWSN